MEIIRSKRKTLAFQVRPDGTLVVRAPFGMPEAEIEKSLAKHSRWIQNAQARMAAASPTERLSPADLKALAAKAAEVLPPLAAQWADRIGVRYGRITVRNQRSRWGSCSAKGNLNFNCLLMLCPAEEIEYVVVHELCHRKQLNHGPAFWAEVEKAMPDYRSREAWLKTNGTEILRRMTG